MQELIEILKNSLYITGLVIIMMLVIEYFNVVTKGHQFHNLQHSPTRQVILGALLGLIPGCMGGFAAVSLFSHNVFNFGALLASMISDTGDETFVMFAAIPIKYALLLKLTVFVLAIVAGLVANTFVKKRKTSFHFDHELEVHVHEGHSEKAIGNIFKNLRTLSGQRSLLLAGMLIFTISLALGMLEHDHNAHAVGEPTNCTHELAISPQECEHDHEMGHVHEHPVHEHGENEQIIAGHQHNGSFFFGERWLNILFVFIAIGALFIVLAVEEHFLEEHILKHIVYKHFLQIFLWTFGSLLFIYGLSQFVHFDQWISDNQLLMILIAVTIGLIPQSGPHIVFISLFINGQIAFSVLLANSIVQNGHSGLPLLAASKKGFIKVKLIGVSIGFAVGLLGYLVGF